MNWLDKVERKMRWFAVPNLMMLLSGLMLAVFLLELALPEEAVSQYLWLDWNAVRAGQIWRVLSFLILPPAASPFFLLFSLYFFCLMGNGLESQWGASKFTLFYTVGALGTIIGSLFTGFATNQYLNLSLFLAFAAIYPNYTVMVFFLLPVKVKYLALLDVLLYLYLFFQIGWPERVALLLSLANVLLFFSPDIFRHIRDYFAYRKTRQNFRRNMR